MFNKIKKVFSKTKVNCHFCGDPLILKKYAWKDSDDLYGAWEADHIIQRGKGGKKEVENCLQRVCVVIVCVGIENVKIYVT